MAWCPVSVSLGQSLECSFTTLITSMTGKVCVDGTSCNARNSLCHVFDIALSHTLKTSDRGRWWVQGYLTSSQMAHHLLQWLWESPSSDGWHIFAKQLVKSLLELLNSCFQIFGIFRLDIGAEILFYGSPNVFHWVEVWTGCQISPPVDSFSLTICPPTWHMFGIIVLLEVVSIWIVP